MTTIKTDSKITYLDLLHSVTDGWQEAIPCHDHGRRQAYEALWKAVAPRADHLAAAPVAGHSGWTAFGKYRGGQTPIESLVATMHFVVKCGAHVLTR